MMDAIIAQFRRPSGWLGRLAGAVMAARPSNRARNNWTIDLLDLAQGDQFFELGCGPGLALARAASKTPKGFVTGVDHSPVMAAMARRRLAASLRQGRANILVGDERQLRSFDQRLNAIGSTNVIQFLDDPARYFVSAFAALAPGGRIATTYQPRGKSPSLEKAEAMAATCATLMGKAGFAEITTEWLALKPVPAMCVIGVKPPRL